MTNKTNKETIKRFKKYVREIIKIKYSLYHIAGWTSEEFGNILNLLEKGQQRNLDYIKGLKQK